LQRHILRTVCEKSEQTKSV